MFKRLDDAEGRYIREMVDDLEVQMLLATLNETVARAEASAVEFRDKYDAYSYLWTSDSSEAFKAFCDSAYIELPKTEEQLKVEADMEPDEIPPQPRVPDLAKFDAEIARYRDIAEQVSAMKTPTDIGFLRINSQPAKTALLAIVNKWTLLFTSHLQRYVTEQTQEMHTFETGVLDGLEEDASFSKEALKRNMAHIRDGGFRLWCYQSRAYHSLHLSLCSSQNALHSQGQPRATTQGGRFAQEVRHLPWTTRRSVRRPHLLALLFRSISRVLTSSLRAASIAPSRRRSRFFLCSKRKWRKSKCRCLLSKMESVTSGTVSARMHRLLLLGQSMRRTRSSTATTPS